MSSYHLRYPGPRWSIHFGSRQGIEAFALEELYGAVQSQLPYTLEARQANIRNPREHALVIGTLQNNDLIRQLTNCAMLHLPKHPESYEIACLPAPWDARYRMVTIASGAPSGVLYGVEAFNAQFLPRSQTLTSLPDRSIRDYPRIARRGVWTWGYVIYDYRRFLDHMARLRMNFLTIWNDVPPLNCRDVIAYAHTRGIRLFLGFPWGWGTQYDLGNPADRQAIEAEVLRHYQTEIAPLHPDGIYFQTLTEHGSTEMGGRSVASITCDLVNTISAKLFTVTPGLEIHYGLHATSIQDRYEDLKALDPRVNIVWEDAGALPYAYTPELKDRRRTFHETLAYSLDLAGLIPGAAFGMVPKGWTTLNWKHEFEHHTSFLLGVRTQATIRRLLARRRLRWALVNLLWRQYYRQGIAFYRSLLQATQGNMIVEGLIEDGLFEERIQPSVALFAETIWNPLDEPRKILAHSYSPYYQGNL